MYVLQAMTEACPRTVFYRMVDIAIVEMAIPEMESEKFEHGRRENHADGWCGGYRNGRLVKPNPVRAVPREIHSTAITTCNDVMFFIITKFDFITITSSL